MTCMLIAEMRAKPGNVDKIRNFLSAELPKTRGYEGCLSVLVVQNQDDPNSIILLEHFATRGHYERYLKWRTDTGTLAAVVEMIDGPISFRFCNFFGV